MSSRPPGLRRCGSDERARPLDELRLLRDENRLLRDEIAALRAQLADQESVNLFGRGSLQRQTSMDCAPRNTVDSFDSVPGDRRLTRVSSSQVNADHTDHPAPTYVRIFSRDGVYWVQSFVHVKVPAVSGDAAAQLHSTDKVRSK